MSSPAAATEALSESKKGELILALSIPAAITTAFVICRFISRKMSNAKFWLDDWVMLVTFTLWMASTFAQAYGISVGAGRHFQSLPPQSQVKMAKVLYVTNTLWGAMLGAVQCAILCLYLRLFGIHPAFARACYIVMGLSITWAISTTLAFALQCVPIQAVWDKDIGQETAHAQCIYLPVFFLASGITHIIFDFTIFLMPLPMIWALRLDARRKIGTSIVFLLGAFTTAISIVRVMLVTRIRPIDFTWSYVPLYIWQPLETDVAIICACLPAMGPIVQYLMGHRFVSSLFSRTLDRRSIPLRVEPRLLESVNPFETEEGEIRKVEWASTLSINLAPSPFRRV